MDTIEQNPLLVIVGPTASGKTGLAIKLAKILDGEIISADSRSVYRGMNIGTAKPGIDERAGVLHFGFDVVEPDQRFTAADFQAYAKTKIQEIRNRNKTPILVGGTGLYIDSVIFDYKFNGSFNPELRTRLQELTIQELIEHCNHNNIELPVNRLNKRHLVRAIEIGGVNRERNSRIIDNCVVIGLSPSKAELEARIHERAYAMVANGVVEETSILTKKYSWDHPSMSGSIYPIISKVLRSEIDLDEAMKLAVRSDLKLVKRQLTWFKRNPHILWFESSQDAYKEALELIETAKPNNDLLQ